MHAVPTYRRNQYLVNKSWRSVRCDFVIVDVNMCVCNVGGSYHSIWFLDLNSTVSRIDARKSMGITRARMSRYFAQNVGLLRLWEWNKSRAIYKQQFHKRFKLVFIWSSNLITEHYLYLCDIIKATYNIFLERKRKSRKRKVKNASIWTDLNLWQKHYL